MGARRRELRLWSWTLCGDERNRGVVRDREESDGAVVLNRIIKRSRSWGISELHCIKLFKGSQLDIKVEIYRE